MEMAGSFEKVSPGTTPPGVPRSPGIDPSPGERTPLLSTRWDPHANSAALSGRALDPKPPAQVCNALAHRLQAEVSRERTRRFEALTIVVNLQEDLVLLLLQVQLHTLSLGVLDRVVQGLLGDAIERLLYLQRRLGFVAKAHVDRKLVACLHQCRLFFQSGG